MAISHKQANETLRANNRISDDGIALCKGLSRANAEYVYDYLRNATGEEPPRVVAVFLANLAHALDSAPDYCGGVDSKKRG